MKHLGHFLRAVLFLALAKPFVSLVLGVDLRGREKLPERGPALLVANHNSHLDTLVLMSLFPVRLLPGLRPVAAGDYFLRNRFMRWFSLQLVGILPISRRPTASGGHPLTPCLDALDRGEILILFPEGSRGEPETRGPFKRGVAHLVKSRPEIPVIPVCLGGTGMALPRGEALFVPRICRMVIGEAFTWNGDIAGFMQELENRFDALEAEIAPPPFPAHPNMAQ
jgi:1-acyl-sn-glycerol-3-phosphate acyltransferase